MTASDELGDRGGVPGRLDRVAMANLCGRAWERIVDGSRYEYRRTVDRRRAEIGHEHGAHLWITIEECWQADEVGDFEDLEFLVPAFVDLASRYLDGSLVPPEPHHNGAQVALWQPSSRNRSGVILRRQG